jgi:hypothetical protein
VTGDVLFPDACLDRAGEKVGDGVEFVALDVACLAETCAVAL